MTNQYFTKAATVTSKAETYQNTKGLQTATLICLALLWIRHFYFVYHGNSDIASSYSALIIIFSISNSEVLFTKEKAVNKALNALAKCEGIVFFAWTIVSIIQLLLK